MSKVVKSVGRAVSGVVKGVTKAVSGVVKGVTNVVKNIASSPVGKVILTAGAVYFGGAALMGAMGGASAGTGFLGTISGGLKGAAAGIGNAWTGLKAAGGAVMGGNFSQAGSSLWNGMSGAHSAGQHAVQGGLLNLASPVTPPAAPPGTAAGSDALAKAVTRSAAINAGSQLAGNVMSGMAEEAKHKEELRQQALARQRYNDNVGARLFADGAGYEYDNPHAESAFVPSNYANPYQYTPNTQARPGLLFSNGIGIGAVRA